MLTSLLGVIVRYVVDAIMKVSYSRETQAPEFLFAE
jgi:hypothetical protein